MNTIWQVLSKPIFSLAPMEDVTDTVFRQIICKTGKPDVFFTEFTNVDGIASQGHDIVARRLLFSKDEHPIVAQIWGMQPKNFYTAAKDLVQRGFDGIDINMGCPQHDVTSHGACSALIKNHPLAKEIIQATKEGVRDAIHPRGVRASHLGGENIPVSVKTRIGFKTIQTEEWIGFLLEQNLSLITVHGRTAAEMSKVPCHWDEIGKAVKIRDHMFPRPLGEGQGEGERTLIFGNGDVQSLTEAKEKVEQYGVDGVMIGRGIFHNPWLFAGIQPSDKTITERLDILTQHVTLFQKTWGEEKSFQILKKHFKTYLSDFEGANDMRQQFFETNSYEEALALAENVKRKEITVLPS